MPDQVKELHTHNMLQQVITGHACPVACGECREVVGFVQTIPVDTGRLGAILCVVGPEPRVNPETGQIRVDRDGKTIYLVGVAVRQAEGRKTDTIEVAVPGQPQGIAEGMRVVITDLTAVQWQMGDRSGTSFRATAIAPAPGQAAPASGSAAKRSAGGEG